MNCKHCNEPMKEYLGFNMSSSGEWDCVNAGCTPETTKAPTLGAIPGGTWPWKVSWHQINMEEEAIDRAGVPFRKLQGDDYTIDFTPIQSTLGQPTQVSQASSPSSPLPHTPLSPMAVHTAGVDISTPPFPVPRLGYPGLCSTRPQEGHQPQRLDTPTISPAALQCIRFEMELLDKGDVCEVCTPDGSEYRIVRLV